LEADEVEKIFSSDDDVVEIRFEEEKDKEDFVFSAALRKKMVSRSCYLNKFRNICLNGGGGDGKCWMLLLLLLLVALLLLLWEGHRAR
jgi:hypothetical protein